MKNTITFNNDFTTAYVSSAFMKKARMYGTNEYKVLAAFRAENPNTNIEVRKNQASKNYNLTYANMELYIKSKPNAEAVIAEFERVKQEAMIQKNRHLYVVNWFKAMFPKYEEAELFQKREEKADSVIVLPAKTETNEEKAS